MFEPEKLLAKVKEMGAISSEDVTGFAIACYEDGFIGKDKAELAFHINKEIKEAQNTKEWSNFFVKIISDYLLQDFNSPGEVDAEESNWLLGKIKENNSNSNILQLVQYLKVHTTPFPKELETLLNSLK